MTSFKNRVSLNCFKRTVSKICTKLQVFCECVYEIMGAMYLNSKKLKKKMTEKQNDARIFFLLGIYKPYTVAIEVFKCDLHADIFDYK